MKMFQLRMTERSFSGLSGSILLYLLIFQFHSCSSKVTRVDRAVTRGTIQIISQKTFGRGNVHV